MIDLSKKPSCNPIGLCGSVLQRYDGNRPIWEIFIFVPTCDIDPTCRVQRARVPRFSILKRNQLKAKQTGLVNSNWPQISKNNVPRPLEGLCFELWVEAD